MTLVEGSGSRLAEGSSGQIIEGCVVRHVCPYGEALPEVTGLP